VDRITIYVDLDGTLTKRTEYPEIGEPDLNVLADIQSLQGEGHRIVIHTCRDWFQEEMIREWCKRYYLEPDFVLCGKPFGVYVDDLSVNPRKHNVAAKVRRIG